MRIAILGIFLILLTSCEKEDVQTNAEDENAVQAPPLFLECKGRENRLGITSSSTIRLFQISTPDKSEVFEYDPTSTLYRSLCTEANCSTEINPDFVRIMESSESDSQYKTLRVLMINRKTGAISQQDRLDGELTYRFEGTCELGKEPPPSPYKF